MKKFIDGFSELFSDREDPAEPHFDPVHLGGMIVLVLFSLSVLFWLLWALLVFGGGIQAKVLPLLQVLFTAKTARDFGYLGYPYAMGVFEGWVTNLAALLLAVLAGAVLWRLCHASPRQAGPDTNKVPHDKETL